ncbi:MAG: type II secretion system F family protein [Lachnospiraceae bacterium]|nr:type II secretion system F family protein [Lachnospiraceae bacterium]
MRYDRYRAHGIERWKMIGIGLGITTVFACIFYRSLWVVVFFSPLSLVLLRIQEKKKLEKKRWEFNQQFRQGILSISASLNAGYSIENAFDEAVKDLQLLYPPDADIIQEFRWIGRQLALNVNVEEVLQDLADRTQIEDVENFAEIFQTAKRTGGDLMKIIQQTAKNAGERIEVQREMETAIAEKQLEANVMAIVPLGIIGYLWLSSPGFLSPLYHNILGYFVMTVVLVIYIIAYYIMKKIVNIRL